MLAGSLRRSANTRPRPASPCLTWPGWTRWRRSPAHRLTGCGPSTATPRTSGWRRPRSRCGAGPAARTPAGTSSCRPGRTAGVRCTHRSGAAPAASRPAELVTGWTGGQPLRPIARLGTTRRLRRLAGRDGEVLAEVADDLVVGSLPAPGGAGPGGAGMPEWQEASRWREIEIELVTGPRGLLDSAGGL